MEQRDIYKAIWKNTISHLEVDPTHEGLKRDQIASRKWHKKEKKQIKAKFSGFNEDFMSTYGTQKRFFIDDEELRKTLITDTLKLLNDPYSHFYNIYAEVPFSSKKEKYIKFTKETVKEMITKLFDNQ